MGPKSPKTADELKEMSIVEIVKFLRTWQPPENLFCEPYPEGLGRELSSIVAEAPVSFNTEVMHSGAWIPRTSGRSSPASGTP